MVKAKAYEEVFVRAGFPFNYNADAISELTGFSTVGESRAHQSFKDECDINTILRRFKITGELPSGVRMPTYEDFTEVYDFHSAANAIAEANEAFDAMPAHVRARFKNDPAEFVAFCSDERNRSEAEKLGLVPAKPVLDSSVVGAAAPSEAPKASVPGDKPGVGTVST